MEKTKKITAQEAFKGSKEHMDNKSDSYQFNDFQNRLRQGLTSDWTQRSGSTSVSYWPGYAHDLERMLFDLMKSKTGKGGIVLG